MMNGYAQLTIAQLRIFARNRGVIFFGLLFPVILMLALGTFLGNGGGVSIKTVIVDQDQSAQSKKLVELFAKEPLLVLSTTIPTDQALEQLKKGEKQLVILIPEGYEQKLDSALVDSSGTKTASEIMVYYDQTSQSTAQYGLALVNRIVDQYDKDLVNFFSYVTVKPEGVQSLQLSYIDFLVPGIVAMMIMNNNLNGVAGQISAWRERGILRRMQSTSLRSSTFIAAQITARLILNGAQAIIVLLIASLVFGTQVNGSWLWLLFFVVSGTLAFMSLGFIIASIAKNPEQAGPISGFISFPLLFLGGIFIPISNMPAFLQPVVKLLPISHLSTAMRQVMNVGAGFSDLWFDALMLVIWMVASFIIASRTFKWE
jgi:ABC-2 type transport system permease protein